MSKRNTMVLMLAAFSTLGLAVLSSAWAGQEKGTDQKGTNNQTKPKDAKEGPQAKAVQNLEMAYQLIRYGRQEKNAESLLLAAQIIHKTPTTALKAQKEVKGGKEGAKPATRNNTPKALVMEAKKMTSSPAAEALALATDKILEEEVRGASPGPQKDSFTISPGQTITWRPITFRGNEKAIVDIELFQNGRMLLQVVDQNGNVVARDGVPGHYYNCQWYPSWTGPFTIRLTNLDSISFNCSLLTN